MATANTYDHTGKKLKATTLPSKIFATKINPQILTQALHVYRSNQSQDTSKVQTRGQVSLTKAKAYRQKGTGNARHGAKSAPIFVGGGVAHGPKGLRPARKRLNTKMRHLGLIGAFSKLAENDSISIVSGLGKLTDKTSKLDSLLSKLKTGKKTLILTNESYPNLNQAAKNIGNLSISRFNLTNIYKILNTNTLILDSDTLKPISSWLAGKKTKN